MELNFSTFIFEIINFLILIWILQRFLYKPVLEVIEQRRLAIDQSLAEVKKISREAEKLQSKYENRLVEWEREKKSAMDSLHLKIEKERVHLMKKLAKNLEEEHKKAEVIKERRVKEAIHRSEKIALKQGARFAGLLLKRAVGPELEVRLFNSLLFDLSNLPEKQVESLHALKELESLSIEIVSTYELDQEQRKNIQQLLNSIIDLPADYEYRLDPDLIAGFRISIGPWVLKANLKDELAGFAEIAIESE